MPRDISPDDIELLDEAASRIEALEKELKRYRQRIGDEHYDAQCAHAEVASLSADLDVAREALEKARHVIANLIQFVVEEGRMASDENGDDKWFSENGQMALEAIDAALSRLSSKEGVE